MNSIAKQKFEDIKKIKEQIFTSDDKNKLEQDIINIIEELKENAVKLFQEPSNIKTFLDNIGKFNNYSYNNILLIYLQKPDVNFVAPYKTYKDLGYSVKKEPDSIKIVIPRFSTIVKDNRDNTLKYYSSLNDEEIKIYKDKNNNDIVYHSKRLSHYSIGTVFDISDSTMPYEEIKEKLHPTVDNENAKEYIKILEDLIKKNGFNLRYVDKCTCDGYCNFENKEIVILNNQTDLVKLKVMIHEFAHSLAHTNLENNYEEYKNNRNKYEVEAESIAYVVSNYLNLEVKDFSETYLYSWSKNKDFEELNNSLSVIIEYSTDIIKKIEQNNKNIDLEIFNDKEIVN